jgi:hypothetical protein
VRIAISGSHRVGKSSLIERLAGALPRYTKVEEPYLLLEEDGYECSDPPSLEDFEAQLERSLGAVEQGEQDVLFDRCPADVFAYLLAHGDAAGFDADDWLERARAAMRTLDLVIFVPIEEEDRIALASHEDREYRLAVHQKLHDLLVDDTLEFEPDVLTVRGDLDARVAQVKAGIAELEKRRRAAASQQKHRKE